MDGVAFRKNVAHKRMRTQVPRARVLLLTGELSWRPSGASAASKISSFDTLINTEQAQLAAAVERIASFGPDVLLVERSVPRAAQELLLERGVALAVNVKREVLDRVAWCTGAEVAQSLEGLNGRCVGFCREFEVASLAGLQAASAAAEQAASQPAAAAAAEQPEATAAPDGGAPHKAPGPKSIMLFKGCPRQLGCSILLRGMDAAELSAVKRVAAFAVYVAYWNRLEVSFLADQALAAAVAAGRGQPNQALAAAESERAAAAERGQQPIVSASPHVTYRRERGSEGAESSATAACAAPGAALQPAMSSGPGLGGAAAAGGSNPVPSAEAAAGVPLPSNARLAHSMERASSSGGGSGDLGLRPTSPQDPLSRAVHEIAMQTAAAAEEDNDLSIGGDASSDDEADPGGAGTPLRGAGKGAAPVAAPGAAIYNTQQLWLSISCKNPGKGTLCEPPHPHCMKFYADTGTWVGYECCSWLVKAGFIPTVPLTRLARPRSCRPAARRVPGGRGPGQPAVPAPPVRRRRPAAPAQFCPRRRHRHALEHPLPGGQGAAGRGQGPGVALGPPRQCRRRGGLWCAAAGALRGRSLPVLCPPPRPAPKRAAPHAARRRLPAARFRAVHWHRRQRAVPALLPSSAL